MFKNSNVQLEPAYQGMHLIYIQRKKNIKLYDLGSENQSDDQTA